MSKKVVLEAAALDYIGVDLYDNGMMQVSISDVLIAETNTAGREPREALVELMTLIAEKLTIYPAGQP